LERWPKPNPDLVLDPYTQIHSSFGETISLWWLVRPSALSLFVRSNLPIVHHISVSATGMGHPGKSRPYCGQNKRRPYPKPGSLTVGVRAAGCLASVSTESPPGRQRTSALASRHGRTTQTGHAVSPQLDRTWSPGTPKPTKNTITKGSFRKALGLNERDMEGVMKFGRHTCQNCGTFDPTHFEGEKPSIRKLVKVHPHHLERTLDEVSPSVIIHLTGQSVAKLKRIHLPQKCALDSKGITSARILDPREGSRPGSFADIESGESSRRGNNRGETCGDESASCTIDEQFVINVRNIFVPNRATPVYVEIYN